MRIVEDTPSRLALRDRTLLISLVCFGGAVALLVRFFIDRDNGLLVGAGLSLAFGLPFLRATDLVLDKDQRLCSLRRLDVLRVRRQTLAFEDISDIRVEVEPMGGDSQVISCRFGLVTSSSVIPLTVAYEPDLERYDRMRDTVLDTLFHAGARPAAVDPVLALVKQGQLVSAVALLRKRDGLDLLAAKTRVDEMRSALDGK